MAVVAVVIIITFVFWGSQTGGGPEGRMARPSPGRMNGKPVPYAEFEQQQRAFCLMYYLRQGQMIDRRRMEQQLQAPTWQRLLVSRKIEKLGIHVPVENAVEFIQQLPLFQGDKGFDPERYRRFVGAMLPQWGLNEEEFVSIVQGQLAIDKLQDIVASTAKVTPLDVQQAYNEANEQLSIAVVEFSATNYTAQVNLSDKEIKDEFEKSKETYRIPERVKVSYLKFSLDDYLPKVKVTDDEIKERYNKEKEAFTDPKTKQVKPLDAVRDEIRKEIARPRAMKMVNEAASEINDAVLPDPRNPTEKKPDLATVVQKRGLAMATTDFFSEKDELKFITAPKFQKAAMTLSADSPYELVPAPDGAYFIQFVARKASELPAFDAVRPKVVEDLKRMRALEMARKDGREKYAKFKAALDLAGKPKPALDHLAAANGVKSLTPPAFTVSEPPRDLPYGRLVLSACEFLAPGELSDFIDTAAGGLIVQVKERKPADPKKLAEAEKTLRHRLLFGERFFGYGQPGQRDLAFNNWLEIEARNANIEPARQPDAGKGEQPEER
ncbi:MAG: peptidyl-prolyl cis-trans isomerase [Verrucomicrobia bacterium]|nr:peptidyl-prolyl cis-trans isomerase [Verrucomicrobiota bacterium]